VEIPEDETFDYLRIDWVKIGTKKEPLFITQIEGEQFLDFLKILQKEVKKINTKKLSQTIDIDESEGRNSKKDRNIYFDIIKFLKKQGKFGVSEEKLVEKIKSLGENNPQKMIKFMKMEGTIYEPKPKHYSCINCDES